VPVGSWERGADCVSSAAIADESEWAGQDANVDGCERARGASDDGEQWRMSGRPLLLACVGDRCSDAPASRRRASYFWGDRGRTGAASWDQPILGQAAAAAFFEGRVSVLRA